MTALQRAAAFALLAAASFALMGSLIKFATAELNNPMVVVLRNAFGLLVLAPWLFRHPLNRLATARPGMHLLRCVIGLSAMYCFFFAIGELPLATAMLFNYATPLYVPLIAWLWLGEKPAWRLLPIVLLGFAGVALILRPGGDSFADWAGLVGLGAGVLAAAAFVSIRRLSRTEPPLRIVFWFTSLSLGLSLLPLFWAWQTPSAGALGLMAGAGLCASGGQLALTRAYSLAPAAQVAPFNYLVVLFAAGLGWLIWQEVFDPLSIIGALLVIGSSLLALRRR